MRAAGTACTLAYLLGLGWLAPFLTALVAASDDEHRVLLSVSVDGARVVLAHDATRPGMESGHRHCMVAAVLAAMANDAPRGADHVLMFPSGLQHGGSGSRPEVQRVGGIPTMVAPWLDVAGVKEPCRRPCPRPPANPAARSASSRMLESIVLRC